ncbi:hypothetical protein [Fibrobacter sp. UWP2]|uniref:hypothetical protein n=1 Tax=Fibrobacter sp. UWP2 TaxID=1896216 RepID=UPI000911F099|nr:hypothetical protein [Fibrobacter sp. UWP2]SHI82148.1 hypothetical protein SAMN05720471_10890 [Fibrobacter sp. UWP2]
MKRILLLLLAFSVLTFADKPTGEWNITSILAVYSTVWVAEGTLIDAAGVKVCHYTGQIAFPADEEGFCPTVEIRHLAKAAAEYKSNHIAGLHCYYDYGFPAGGLLWSIDNLRESCPDIIVTVFVKSVPKVIGEYYFKPMENQTIYYEDKTPIRQVLDNTREVMDRFGKKYENQIRYRDTYDWVQLKPGPGWDAWERPGSVYEPGRNPNGKSKGVWR